MSEITPQGYFERGVASKGAYASAASWSQGGINVYKEAPLSLSDALSWLPLEYVWLCGSLLWTWSRGGPRGRSGWA